ncbi:MAG: hypothetical protein HY018_09570 [Hydrogenophilales bacterium]|nr:hypothetical protein [Hydrogenophilales bacterium]
MPRLRVQQARTAIAILVLAVSTAGCTPITLTAASLGASMGVSHTTAQEIVHQTERVLSRG